VGARPTAARRSPASPTQRAYLPGVDFPPSLSIEPQLERALASAGELLIAVPSHAFRALLETVKPLLRAGTRVAWATKGFELDSGLLPNQVARAVLGHDVRTAVLSGPTFAREVGAGLPTAMTIASRDEAYALEWARALSSANFRAYSSADVTGVEVGGATKNVLAIGAGCSDGLGYGANTRVALITRGLAEMMRLGVALGADKDTFMGLAGLGDLGIDLYGRPVRGTVASVSPSHAARAPPRRRRRSIRSSRVCSRRERARSGAEGSGRDADHRADLPRALREPSRRRSRCRP
jgi:glycerol-3-phosphate dehydrogenase (NAD(P)+)